MRHKGVRAVAVGLSLATMVVSGCSATHARPAAKPTPSASAPSSGTRPNASVTGLSAAAIADRFAGLSLRCRADIENGRLIAPFWLQFDHLDPARGSAEHTVAEAAHAYRTESQTRGLDHRGVHIAYADYTDFNGDARPTIPVWIVVSYGVRAISTMSSTPMRTDEVVILKDSDLQALSIIQTLPSRCA